jgi:tRNA (cmo5U34)-methyltransferase
MNVLIAARFLDYGRNFFYSPNVIYINYPAWRTKSGGIMAGFDKTRWAEEDFARKYLDGADINVVDRRRLLVILQSFYNHFHGDSKQNRVLDLGCGDGIIAHELLKIDSSLSATLIDGSEDMLHKAKKRLAGFKNVQYIRASFQELLGTDIQLPSFEFIVSSLAIHHLTMSEKKSLFKYLYAHLTPGGHFVNIDIILSPTKALESWYFKLWMEWIIEKRTALNLERSNEDITRDYKAKEHYRKLDTLTRQLNALEEAGFKDVDCYYKQGIFTMYGGSRE